MSTSTKAEIIGILGGMGPAATADFYAKLVAITPGSSDQDHLRTVIWSDPTIPDRTEALLGGGPDPTPWLLDGSRVLREAGATVIAIPCNTAHAFVPRIADRVGLPIVHMIGEVARHLSELTLVSTPPDCSPPPAPSAQACTKSGWTASASASCSPTPPARTARS